MRPMDISCEEVCCFGQRCWRWHRRLGRASLRRNLRAEAAACQPGAPPAWSHANYTVGAARLETNDE